MDFGLVLAHSPDTRMICLTVALPVPGWPTPRSRSGYPGCGPGSSRRRTRSSRDSGSSMKRNSGCWLQGTAPAVLGCSLIVIVVYAGPAIAGVLVISFTVEACFSWNNLDCHHHHCHRNLYGHRCIVTITSNFTVIMTIVIAIIKLSHHHCHQKSP